MVPPSKSPRTRQPDDVEALCSIAGLNSIGYKRFAGTVTTKLDLPVKASAPPEGGKARQPAAAEQSQTALRAIAAPTGGPMRLLGPGLCPLRPAAGRFHPLDSPASRTGPAEPTVSPTVAESPGIPGNSREASWAAIERVFNQGPKGSANTVQARRAWQLIPFYSGGGGGVGVTTIMGMLARCLSSQGDRILLIDGTPGSPLGFFFNGVASPEGVSSFAPESSAGNEANPRGRVDISCRPAGGPNAEDAEAWALQSIAQLGAEADRVFVDIGAEVADRSQLCVLAAGNPLVIVAPDFRCVPGINRLMRLFTDQEQVLERYLMPSFLLNLFDPGIPFHVEILNRLGELLGDRLLPIYIPRMDEISGIAADGMTTVDFNQGSAAADSFRRLAEWIRTSRRASPSAVPLLPNPGNPCGFS